MTQGLPNGSAILRLTLGFFILAAGLQLLVRQIGLIQMTVDLLPLALTILGALVVAGGIYRLKQHTEPNKESSVSSCRNNREKSSDS